MIRILLAALLVLVPTGAMAQAAKPTVAVVSIQDLTNSGRADTLSTMIETAIAQTGRFRLIERQQINQLLGEQVRAKGGVVTTNTPGKVGGIEGVDYLIYGTITSVSGKRKADIGTNLVVGFLGNHNANCNTLTATLALDIKITDAASGEIRYIRHIDESQKSGTSCSANADIDSAKLMRAAADKVANGLVTTIYPIVVAAVNPDGSMILNYGEGTLDVGDVLELFAKGQEIRDPTTGQVLGSNETQIGLVRVSTINGRMSTAVPVGTLATAPAVGTLARIGTAEQVKLAAQMGKHR